MKPAPFEYIRAESEEHIADCLARGGDDARILAGGQSLIAMLSMRLVQPRFVVDISRLAVLDEIRLTGPDETSLDGQDLVVGAATTQSSLAHFPNLATIQPLLAMALPHVGHFQTRNKGTVCGSIAHADPSSELPLCMAVLDGRVHLMRYAMRGNYDGRVVQGRDFHTGLLQTQRDAKEFMARVSFPLARLGEGYAFNEMAIRHGDFAIVAVAVKATATNIRIGIGGAADKPHVRDWPLLDGSALGDALNALAWELEFQEDAHASAKYRRHLVRTLGRRTILEALGRRGDV
jgi:2-furoyl-CoA dehydrogenase FAD binding subunit